jgi:hypothetical protein
MLRFGDFVAALTPAYAGVTARAIYGMSDAPEFVLLDPSGPRPRALALSFGFSSTLLVLAVVLAHPTSATPAARVELISEVVVARGPLWLPAKPPLLNSHRSATPHSDPDPPAQESHQLSVADPPGEAAASVDPPATVVLKSQQSLPPPPSEAASPAPKPASEAAGVTHDPANDARKPAPDALGTLPLPRLIEDEAALAASLAALPSDRRLALPSLSIRVDAEWLEALPQTKEELYFSVTRPQGDSEVLAYLPATHGFTLKRPLQPLWQIREGEQVPALAALRSAAASRLGVPPEFVGLYTWHPPVLENALRMFVFARMQQMGVQLGPGDVVTVRFASGPDGCLMSLEPISGAQSQ